MACFRKISCPIDRRSSLLKTMVTQLVKHEGIETSVTKAKDIRRLPDNMVQIGKEDTLCAARRAAAFVRGDDVIHKWFTEMAFGHNDRAGQDTRFIRNISVGDAALIACIEFVNRENELKQLKPGTRQPRKRHPPLDPWSLALLTRQKNTPLDRWSRQQQQKHVPLDPWSRLHLTKKRHFQREFRDRMF